MKSFINNDFKCMHENTYVHGLVFSCVHVAEHLFARCTCRLFTGVDSCHTSAAVPHFIKTAKQKGEIKMTWKMILSWLMIGGDH